MALSSLFALARRRLGGAMESSARLCLEDAVRASDEGRLDDARAWAVRSLRYSVGVFDPDYVKAYA